jgi:riboflavin synthase alpha subunit
MKKLIAFALAACTVGAISVAGATAAKPDRTGLFAGAIHADVTALFAEGKSVATQLDRGKVTALGDASLTVVRLDKQSLTFKLTGETDFRHGKPKVGDNVGVESRDGAALRVNVWRKDSSTAADAQKKAEEWAGVIHADISLLLKDGSSKSETMDRGKVTAVDPTSITILRVDKKSLTFSVKDRTDGIKVGDSVTVFASGGQAFLIRHHEDKAKTKTKAKA